MHPPFVECYAVQAFSIASRYEIHAVIDIGNQFHSDVIALFSSVIILFYLHSVDVYPISL